MFIVYDSSSILSIHCSKFIVHAPSSIPHNPLFKVQCLFVSSSIPHNPLIKVQCSLCRFPLIVRSLSFILYLSYVVQLMIHCSFYRHALLAYYIVVHCRYSTFSDSWILFFVVQYPFAFVIVHLFVVVHCLASIVQSTRFAVCFLYMCVVFR